MRKIIIGISVLILPTIVALTVFLIANKKIPTKRGVIGQAGTLAGNGSIAAVDGKVASAGFADPFGIAVDRRGNIVVADGGEANRIRKISPSGIVETIAGSSEGFADGPAFSAKFNTPSGVVVNRRGDIFIADTSNNRIRKLSSDGTVTTIAGSGAAGALDGRAEEAQFDGPIGVAAGPDGSVLVADTYNDRIRRISESGEVVTIAGSDRTGYLDGDGAVARFDTPSGVAVDEQGNVFVADTGNSAIRKIDLQGQVTTILKRNSHTGVLRALTHPIGIAITHDGFLYVTCEEGILRLTPEGELEEYSGGKVGFADGAGRQARFNNPACIALDRDGNVYVADTQNHSVRMILPANPQLEAPTADHADVFIQPFGNRPMADPGSLRPQIGIAEISNGATFPWPVAPQDRWHEIAGVAGEARGAPGGVALDHLHSGLDVRGSLGEPALAVYEEKVSSPRPNWDFDGTNEGMTIGLMSYIHVRVGRDQNESLLQPDRFKGVLDDSQKLIGVRVRRGTRFKVGDPVGTINRMYHVHLNLGPWNAQINPIGLPFAGFRDTVPPVIEPAGVALVGQDGRAATEKREGRVVVRGDVEIWVTAFDRVDGNGSSRKLGLYKIGYQILNEDGSPVKGYEQPLVNIEFNRLPPDDPTVSLVYAPGSGVSAYGTPTRFIYRVTNVVRDGFARRGLLRTSELAPGKYLIRIDARDFAGNRASGTETELPIMLVP